MVKGVINKILPFSSVDGHGNRCVIFLQGCNFNCLYCHNPETINFCDNCGNCIAKCFTGALAFKIKNHVDYDQKLCIHCDRCLMACLKNSSPKTKIITVSETIMEVLRVKSFISGITVSGGECSLQPKFLTKLFYQARQYNLTTFIDSNGSILYESLPNLMSVCDAVMLDVKSFDNNEHLRLTGKDNYNVLANLEFLAYVGKLYEVRTVIVPEIIDNEHTVNQVSKILAKIAPQIRYKLIKFRNYGVRTSLTTARSPSDAYMAKLVKIATDYGLTNVVLV